MNKVEFLHAVEASAIELRDVLKENATLVEKREEITERAERHLENLYKLLDICAKNLPNGLIDD